MGKPKRYGMRGTIQRDPNRLKTERIKQAGKNLYQVPISFMVKAPVMTLITALAAGTSFNRAVGLNKTRDQTPFGHKFPTTGILMHDRYVKNYSREIRGVWDADIWKGDHKEGNKPYMQSGELIKKTKKAQEVPQGAKGARNQDNSTKYNKDSYTYANKINDPNWAGRKKEK